MKRRAFILLGLSAGASSATAYLPGSSRGMADLESLARQEICVTGRAAPRVTAGGRQSRSLSFAGTRLFKEGFLDDIGRSFQQKTGRRIQILGGGCDDGLKAVREDFASIGGLCCPLQGSGAEHLQHVTVAHDLKVVVAHPRVSVSNLRWAELVSIMTGSITNWQVLGGTDQRIATVIHDHCPDYVEPARRQILGDRLQWSLDALHVKTDQKHLDTVARFESAVGVNSWILAQPYVAAGKLKVLAIDGVDPTIGNAAAGRYRLLGPMNMVFERWEQAMAPFFEYLFSPDGRAIMSRRVVPVTLATA